MFPDPKSVFLNRRRRRRTVSIRKHGIKKPSFVCGKMRLERGHGSDFILLANICIFRESRFAYATFHYILLSVNFLLLPLCHKLRLTARIVACFSLVKYSSHSFRVRASLMGAPKPNLLRAGLMCAPKPNLISNWMGRPRSFWPRSNDVIST